MARLSGVWSSNKDFVRYLNSEILQNGTKEGKVYGLKKTDLNPADYIRETCNIRSRKDLDTDIAAADRFKAQIRAPFMAWTANSTSEAGR